MAIPLNASFQNNRNNGLAVAKAASTLFEVGYFLTFNGTGQVIPVSNAGLATDKILGLSNEQVTAATSGFTTTKDIGVSTPVNVLDQLDIPVTIGTATAALVGTYVDVDPANPGAVDVSIAGDQILVLRVIDAANIVGTIAKTV